MDSVHHVYLKQYDIASLIWAIILDLRLCIIPDLLLPPPIPPKKPLAYPGLQLPTSTISIGLCDRISLISGRRSGRLCAHLSNIDQVCICPDSQPGQDTMFDLHTPRVWPKCISSCSIPHFAFNRGAASNYYLPAMSDDRSFSFWFSHHQTESITGVGRIYTILHVPKHKFAIKSSAAHSRCNNRSAGME